MPRTIQIRNVAVHIHRILKARAAQEGMSLSAYLLIEIRKSAEYPTNAELMKRLAKLPPVDHGMSSAEIVRQGREERMRDLDRALGINKRRRR